MKIRSFFDEDLPEITPEEPCKQGKTHRQKESQEQHQVDPVHEAGHGKQHHKAQEEQRYRQVLPGQTEGIDKDRFRVILKDRSLRRNVEVSPQKHQKDREQRELQIRKRRVRHQVQRKNEISGEEEPCEKGNKEAYRLRKRPL